MARYWVFAGNSYYPSGGAHDLHSTVYDDKAKAIEYAKSQIGKDTEDTPTRSGGSKIDWVHVFDIFDKDVVFIQPDPNDY